MHIGTEICVDELPYNNVLLESYVISSATINRYVYINYAMSWI